MNLLRLHHAAIIASDYPLSKAFYTDVLGLRIIAETYREARDSWKLDLELPDGTQIDFESPESPSGGKLDLDSNALCDIDGTNIENIFWPPGSAPEGEYAVLVGYYDACVMETVNYTVTITVGDAVTTVSGSFDPDDAFLPDENEEDSLRQVATFTVD